MPNKIFIYSVVCPVIDIIDSINFKYIKSPVCKGGMSWSMVFQWDYPVQSYFNDPHNYVAPLKSATMAGGLFAIDRDFFNKIGQYDSGMNVWGAENVEISIRVFFAYFKDFILLFVIKILIFQFLDMALWRAIRNNTL